jgi:hypothetical protein
MINNESNHFLTIKIFEEYYSKRLSIEENQDFYRNSYFI